MKKVFLPVAFVALFVFCLAPVNAMADGIVRLKDDATSTFPISSGTVANGFVFASGQLGIDPATKQIPMSIEEQTKFAMENLKKVLEAGGSSLDDTVKVTIYLKDLFDFETVNKIYATYFKKDFPARTCFQVSALPLGGLIEIEAIGVVVKK